MKLKALSLVIGIGTILSFNAFSAEDGIIGDFSSEGSINVSVMVKPFISVTNLNDMEFTDINPLAMDSDYSQTLETDICVFTNFGQFELDIVPENGYMSNDYYTQDNSLNLNSNIQDNSQNLKSHIPVKYSLFSNEYSEGVKVSETELASDFTSLYKSNLLSPNLNTNSINCIDYATGNTNSNYTLKGTIEANDIIGAAAGYYSQTVFIRASIPMIDITPPPPQ